MLAVSAADAQLYNARIISSTALPVTIPALNTGVFNVAAVTVPRDEQWQISYFGFYLSFSDTFLNVPIRFYPRAFITNSAGLAPFSGPSNAAAMNTPIPLSYYLNDAIGEAYVYLSLQGVILQRGDVVSVGGWIVNDDTVTPIDLNDVQGTIRYLPMRLVSELAVARLQNDRADQLLDVRTRASRG